MLRTNFTNNYGFDPVRFLPFEKYLHTLKGITVYYGLGLPDTTGDTNKRILVDLETPNYIYRDDRYNPDDFDAIFMLCPLSINYYNAKYNTKKFHLMWFPIELPPELTLDPTERRIPVFYTGHPNPHFSVLTMIDNAITKYLGPTKELIHRFISAPDYSGYVEKLRVLSFTKICICHNVLHYNKNIPNYLAKFDDKSYTEFFPWHGKPFGEELYMPQLKSRVFEGALMGCVLLVFKDKYNTLDNYFEENKDFLYYSTEEELHEKIDSILANYETYAPIAKSAQQKVLQKYSVKSFVDYVVETLSGGENSTT